MHQPGSTWMCCSCVFKGREVSQISFHGNLETRFEHKETFSLQKDELEERRKENRLQRNKNGD